MQLVSLSPEFAGFGRPRPLQLVPLSQGHSGFRRCRSPYKINYSRLVWDLFVIRILYKNIQPNVVHCLSRAKALSCFDQHNLLYIYTVYIYIVCYCLDSMILLTDRSYIIYILYIYIFFPKQNGFVCTYLSYLVAHFINNTSKYRNFDYTWSRNIKKFHWFFMQPSKISLVKLQ